MWMVPDRTGLVAVVFILSCGLARDVPAQQLLDVTEAPVFKFGACDVQEPTRCTIRQRVLRDQFVWQVKIEIGESLFGVDLHGFTGHEVGAGRGNRTHTLLPEPDFESGASTSSASPAWNWDAIITWS